jgi:hypothetical protein
VRVCLSVPRFAYFNQFGARRVEFGKSVGDKYKPR